jgi:cytoskeletal protein CcmA (bactofilin family)
MPTTTPSTSPTTVGADAEFEGILSGKDAQILGRFKGEVLITGKLSIGDGAVVDAKVTADTVEIAGAFKGSLAARALILLEKARVDGSVEAKSLSIRDGALLNGAVNVAAAASAAKPAAAPGAATG